jgi:anti-anti-sigma factor
VPVVTAETSRLDTSLAIVLAGEIDSYTAPELAAIFTKHPDIDVVDLRDVSFIDSSGLRVLVEIHQQRAESERSLILRAPSAAVQRLLEISGVAGHLSVED